VGDRAIIVLQSQVKVNGEVRDLYSPKIYLHWDGKPETVREYLEITNEIMEDRTDDLHYYFARLCGVIHTNIEGNMSFGVSNTHNTFQLTCWYIENILSHGDNGVYVYNIDKQILTQFPYEGHFIMQGLGKREVESGDFEIMFPNYTHTEGLMLL
jgi:hypothetical protein